MTGGLNTYAYVDGNPILYTDPLGLIPPGWYKNIPPGSPWAVGLTFTASTINPFTSTSNGGGEFGYNVEYTTSTGWHVYKFYTPQDKCSANNKGSKGIEPGVSLTVNLATGQGNWTGPFNQVDANIGYVSFGQFNSVGGSSQNGYYGGQIGVGVGLPYGIGTTTTNYKRVFH